MRGLYGNLLLPSKQAFNFMRSLNGDTTRTGEPARTTVAIAEHGRSLDVDVYMPPTPPRAGLVLIPGVAKDGKDDARMVTFASTVARNGFGVVVPDLASLRQLVVRSDHYLDVVAAYRYLLSRPDLAPGGRAGIGGMSFAIGPGLRAALEPAIRDEVRFLFCIGGYFDIMATLMFVTTGDFRGPDGVWRHIEQDRYGRWVLARSLMSHIPDEGSRTAMEAISERRLADGEADISDLLPALTDPGAQALLDLARNTDREQVNPLFARLPGPMRTSLLAMDLSSQDLNNLKARMILVHGYEDTLIAYTESEHLYRRAPKGGHRLYLVNGLGHVTMKKPGPIDAWALLSSVTALLRERG